MDIQLPPDLEKAVRQRADSARMEPERWIIRAIKDQVGRRDMRLTAWKPLRNWDEQFDAFVSVQKSTNPKVDDSRDGIYADR